MLKQNRKLIEYNRLYLYLNKILKQLLIHQRVILVCLNIEKNKFLYLIYLVSSNIKKSFIDENDLLDRLKDDFDSQPEFHCHLFGLGGRGRGRSLSIQSSPPKPSFTRQNDYRSLQQTS